VRPLYENKVNFTIVQAVALRAQRALADLNVNYGDVMGLTCNGPLCPYFLPLLKAKQLHKSPIDGFVARIPTATVSTKSQSC
jgi:hypothetical protein